MLDVGDGGSRLDAEVELGREPVENVGELERLLRRLKKPFGGAIFTCRPHVHRGGELDLRISEALGGWPKSVPELAEASP